MPEESLSNKEILLRLMDKMDKVEREQATHHAFAKGKLESIENQALKTNGRVTASEQKIEKLEMSESNTKVVFTTLATLLTASWGIITFIFK